MSNYRFILILKIFQRDSCAVIAEGLDCGFIVSEFTLQSYYYIHFWKGMNTLILLTMGQIVSLLFFNMDVFGIK